MRVLFCTTPGAGHALPLVPTAWGLRSAGHEVLFAAAGDATTLGNAGLPVVDVAPGLNVGEFFYRFAPAPNTHVELQRANPGLEYLPFIQTFAEISRAMAEQTVALARRWQPDLVIHTLEQGTGPLAAAAVSVPSAVHGFGFSTPIGAVTAIAEYLEADYRRYRVRSYRPPAALLDLTPPSLRPGPEPDPATSAMPMRYLPYCGGGVLPEWLAGTAVRPRVVVTLGTTVTQHVGVAPVRPLVEVASEVDAEFVLLLGSADPGTLGTLPDNVRACGWVPLDAVLRDATALVHHGGSGTMLVGLTEGVPQLVLPQSHDQLFHATALRERGAGRTAEAEEVTADLISELINDENLRNTAAELRREMTELPTPVQVADQLTKLVQNATGNSAA